MPKSRQSTRAEARRQTLITRRLAKQTIGECPHCHEQKPLVTRSKVFMNHYCRRCYNLLYQQEFQLKRKPLAGQNKVSDDAARSNVEKAGVS